MYIILLFYLFFIIFNNDKLHRRKQFNTYYYILLLFTVVMAGFSYRMGYDSLKYEDSFLDYSDKLSQIWREIEYNSFKEPGWIALNISVKALFGSFVYLKIIIALFVNSVIFWFFKKHLSNPGIGILLYYLIVGWSINYEILRASISIAIFLIAVEQLMKPKANYLKFYIYFLPALLFHWFAFILLLTPLVFLLKPSFTYLAICLGAFMLVPLIISLGLNTDLGFLGQLMGERVDTYLSSDDFGDRGLNIRGIIFSLMTSSVPIIYLVYSHRKEINNKILSFSLAYALFSILRLGLDILYRITDYLSFVMILLLSIVLIEIKHSKSKATDWVCMILISISIVMTISSSNVWLRYVPYTSVFDKQMITERENLYNDLGYEEFPINR